MIPKADLLDIIRKETATTLRVMRAFPHTEGAFRPHERSNSALDVIRTFVFEMNLVQAYAFGKTLEPDFFKTYNPESIEAGIADFEREALDALAKLEECDEDALNKHVEFGGVSFTADRFILMMLHDQIHHRGQLSVYVRMAGGKVPSIYGPSADDPSTNL